MASGNQGNDQSEEIRQIKRELARVTEERDTLKKSDRVFRQGCKVKDVFVSKHQALFSVRTMCRLLRIHPSGFYAWLRMPLSKRACEDERQIGLLRKAWEDSSKVYGSTKRGAIQIGIRDDDLETQKAASRGGLIAHVKP